ncbi:MAG: MnmC family methyltransferase [Butyricimonas faecalis]
MKGTVKQALRNIGFNLKRLPGPPGKREMLRAVKQF